LKERIYNLEKHQYAAVEEHGYVGTQQSEGRKAHEVRQRARNLGNNPRWPVLGENSGAEQEVMDRGD